MSGYAEGRADQRIANLIQTGVVEEVDYSNPPRARVRIGDLLTGWLRMGTPRAGDAHQFWGYSVGEEVVIGATSGDLRQGVILCAMANGGNVAEAAAGTHRTTYPGGVVIEVSGGNVTITAPGTISLKAGQIRLND